MSPFPLGILAASGVSAEAGDFELLETTTLASDTASVTFSGLGSYTDYKHLQIRYVARTDRSGTNDYFRIRYNSDSTASYARHSLAGDGSSVFSFGGSTSFNASPEVSGGSDVSNAYGASVFDILDFSSTSKNTTLRALGGASSNVARIDLFSGAYFKTDAITSIELTSGNFANIVTGSRFSLYGIRG